jgi:creatinine amidohydrolase
VTRGRFPGHNHHATPLAFSRIFDSKSLPLWHLERRDGQRPFVHYVVVTFEAVVHEIASGIFDSGCRKLLVLNTGISTLAPVERALARLEAGKVMHLRIHDGPRYRQAAEQLAEQSHGSHADELETSLMLALAPHLVEMVRAEPSPAIGQEAPGPLTPSDVNSPNYSRSGSYGDPTLATSAKGEIMLAAMLDDLGEQVTAFMAEGAAAKQRSDAVRSVSR